MENITTKKHLAKVKFFSTGQSIDHKALEFQPDSVELESQPVPLSTRLTYYILLLLLLSAFIWSVVAKMDMIVSARGRLITTGKQVVVQPLVNSIVKQLHVDVGQVVKQGQSLVSLDPTFAMADEAQIQVRLEALSVLIKRLEAELAGDDFTITPGMKSTEAALQFNLFNGRKNEYDAKMSAYASHIMQARGEVQSFKTRLESLDRQLQMAKEVLGMRKKVFSEGADTRLSVLEAETKFSALSAEVEGIKNELNVRIQRSAQALSESSAFTSNWRNEIVKELLAARKERDSLVEQFSKASRFRELAELSSPVDAVVLDVGLCSVGSVVKEGMAIMTLVPLNIPLEAEVFVETKDVGYVHIGDPVRLKLDAFPFQRHGTIEGKLRIVSEDTHSATSGDNMGNKLPTYHSRVELTNTTLKDVSKDTRYLPGMTLTAEIVVGERRVITFLAYPLIRGIDESLREP